MPNNFRCIFARAYLALVLSACNNPESHTNPPAECTGGTPADHLAYIASSDNPRVEPAPGSVSVIEQELSRKIGINEIYLRTSLKFNTRGKYYQTLDEPLQPDLWVRATRQPDLKVYKVEFVVNGKTITGREIVLPSRKIRADEFCIDSSDQLYSRPKKER